MGEGRPGFLENEAFGKGPCQSERRASSKAETARFRKGQRELSLFVWQNLHLGKAAWPESSAAICEMADQSSDSPPRASRVRKRSRIRLASGRGTRSDSPAASVRRTSLSPSGATKPAGVNFLSAISPP